MSSEGQSDLSSEEGSPYAIVPSNARGGSFTPTNYSISYVSGVLTVSPITEPTNLPPAEPVVPSTPDVQGTSEQQALPNVPLRDVQPAPLTVVPSAEQMPGPVILGAPAAITSSSAVNPALVTAPASTPVPAPLPLAQPKAQVVPEQPRSLEPMPIGRPLKQDRN